MVCVEECIMVLKDFVTNIKYDVVVGGKGGMSKTMISQMSLITQMLDKIEKLEDGGDVPARTK